MVTRKEITKIAERLQKAAEAKGLHTPTQLARAIQKATGKKDRGMGAVKNHWYGENIPAGVNLLIYSRVLDVSIDWLLTGKEPDPPDISQLKGLLNSLAAKLDRPTPTENPVLSAIVEEICQLKPELQETLLTMIRNLRKDE